MGIETQLSSALGRRDELPNIALADKIVLSGDRAAVTELVTILAHGNRPLKNDAIKVLYEIGDRNPSLISDHADAFLVQMHSASNRLVWGALTALACISRIAPAIIFDNLDDILLAADKGSVIAKDQAISILVTLAAETASADTVMPILLDRLKSSAVNQLPMYAEKIAPILPISHIPVFKRILEDRLSGEMAPSKRRRIEAALRQV